MLTCPDCQGALARGFCGRCGWKLEAPDGIPRLIGSQDLEDRMVQRYFENYDVISRDDLEEGVLDARFVENRAAHMAQIAEPVKGQNVCDLGCGRGDLTRALVARGAAKVTAVDISMAYLRRLRGADRVEPVLANAENLPWRSEFDVITTTDVMEHVLNVGAFLYSVNRALRPGGRLYVRVPYNEDLLQYAPQMGCPYRLVHLRSYDRALLKRELRHAGLKTDRFWLGGFWPGTPRRFWLLSPSLSRSYNGMIGWLRRRGLRDGDFTRLPYPIAGICMRPLDLLVRARKIGELPEPRRADGRRG